VILGCESTGVIFEQSHPQYLSTAAKSKGLGTRHWAKAAELLRPAAEISSSETSIQGTLRFIYLFQLYINFYLYLFYSLFMPMLIFILL